MTILHFFRNELLFRLNPKANLSKGFRMLFKEKYEGRSLPSVFVIVNSNAIIIVMMILCYPFCLILDFLFSLTNAELELFYNYHQRCWKRRDPQGYENFMKAQQQKAQAKKEGNDYVYKV